MPNYSIHSPNRISAVATVALAVIAVLQCIVLVFQYREMARTTQGAAAALKLEQRPWVGISGFQPYGPVKLDKDLKMQCLIHNTGRQPAKLQLDVTYDVLPGGINDKDATQALDVEASRSSPQSVTILLPDALNPCPARGPLTDEEITEVMDGDARLYFLARVLYTESTCAAANSNCKQHETDFCQVYDRAHRQFFGCEKFNTAN